MVDLDRVVDSHQVDENKSLLLRFFPAAWKCTKASAFVVVCGDAMLWQHMYDAAIGAGFAVQRWPYIWRKINQNVMNNCAGYNTTKNYEIVMLCRKPGATLAEKRNTSFSDCGNTEAKKVTNHPFAKPFELTRDLCQMVSHEGQTILEPFAGGGSLVLQMLRMKRNVIALEKDPRSFNEMVENVKREYYLKLNPKFLFK
jgi:DNA modification methylase